MFWKPSELEAHMICLITLYTLAAHRSTEHVPISSKFYGFAICPVASCESLSLFLVAYRHCLQSYMLYSGTQCAHHIVDISPEMEYVLQ